MASMRLILVLSILAIFFVSTYSRPCKTFFISSYSFSRSTFPFANPGFSGDGFPSTGFVVVEFGNERVVPDLSVDAEIMPSESKFSMPFGFSSTDLNSFRAWARDIVSVVAALLFGIGCGALTASTMYLVWSIFSSRREYEAGFEESDDDEADLYSPKKAGYVKVPTSEAISEPVKSTS